MRLPFQISLTLAASLLLFAGCQKLSDERTMQLEPGDEKELTIDAPKNDQKVTVSVSSPGTPVSVYMALQKDAKAGKPLASKEKVENDSIEATIPGGNAFVVTLTNQGRKPASVKVKISGK